MPADGISAAATKGLRQILLAAREPAHAAYNVGRPVGSVHSGNEVDAVSEAHAVALAGDVCAAPEWGRLRSQPIEPLPKVSPQLLTVGDPALRLGQRGLIPVDERLRRKDRCCFGLSGFAGHTDVRHSKSNHRCGDPSRLAACHDRLHPRRRDEAWDKTGAAITDVTALTPQLNFNL